MDLQLQDKLVLISGGSGGIGAAMVRAFVAEGCTVHFCGRSAERIEATLAQCENSRGRAFGMQLDVTDTQAVAHWLDQVGNLDILVANVSALSADWGKTLQLDLHASISLIELALPKLMKSTCAAITYTGSKAASLAAPNSPAYGAIKAAMAHYMKSLATRLAPKVRVNVLSPGDTLCDEGYWDKVRRDDAQAFQQVLARNPFARLATPEEIARVAVFLSSPAASFVSGANWYVDGNSCAEVQF